MLFLNFEKYLFWLVIFLFILLLAAYKTFPLEFEQEINIAASEMSIDPFLIAATIKLESNFDVMALSHSGAFGLMQLMPETANWLKTLYVIQGTWREPLNNIKLGTFYLKRLISDFENDIHHALNAYHMGPTKLKSMINEDNDFRESTYTKRISIYRNIYQILYNDFLLYPGE